MYLLPGSTAISQRIPARAPRRRHATLDGGRAGKSGAVRHGRNTISQRFASANTFPFRLTFWIGACLSGLGLLISTTGIYGVLTYWVNLRSKEFGIRAALGATRGNLIATV